MPAMPALPQLDPWLIAVLVAWSVIWKGIALWHAARSRQLAWYLALLIINTAGLLEIIYLLFFRRKKPARINFR